MERHFKSAAEAVREMPQRLSRPTCTRRSDESTYFDGIRLIIWDLDGTVWPGTLDDDEDSDDTDATSCATHTLVPIIQLLARRGIVSSICSCSNREQARIRLLRLGIWEHFIFPQISSDSSFRKPAAIRAVLRWSGVSPAHAIFCDDEPRHRAEAEAEIAGLRTIHPSKLPSAEALSLCGFADPSCSKLSQYRTLEARRQAELAELETQAVGAAAADDDEAALRFLAGCAVRVNLQPVSGVDDPDLDRLAELTHKANRLNFTRRRRCWYWAMLEEDTELLLDGVDRWPPEALDGEVVEGRGRSWSGAWKVSVSDRFGDYGLVGFVSVASGRLRQLVLSCRLLGLHVEGALYQWLHDTAPQGALCTDIDAAVSDALLRQSARHVTLQVSAEVGSGKHISSAEAGGSGGSVGSGGSGDGGSGGSAGSGDKDSARVLLCGYCSLAPVGALLALRGWRLELAYETYEQFALGSLRTLQQLCCTEGRSSGATSAVAAAVACEVAALAASNGAVEEAAEAAAAVDAASLFARERLALCGGGYNVVCWDLEREILWPIATRHEGLAEVDLPVDLQHALPHTTRCPLVAQWCDLWRTAHGTGTRRCLTEARLLSADAVVDLVRWLRRSLPAATTLVMLDAPPVFDVASPALSPAWRRTLGAFPEALRAQLAEHAASVSASVAAAAATLPNTTLVRPADHLADADLLEWVHTSRRAAASISEAIESAIESAMEQAMQGNSAPSATASDDTAAPVTCRTDADGDIEVPRRKRARMTHIAGERVEHRASSVERLICAGGRSGAALVHDVFSDGQLSATLDLCKALDATAIKDAEVRGFKLATTEVIHFDAHSHADGHTETPGGHTAWIFAPLAAAFREAGALLGMLPTQHAFLTSVQYNRYDVGDHFEQFHLDEVPCATAYKSLSMVVFLSAPDEYGGGEFELTCGADEGNEEQQGAAATTLRPRANSAAVFCARSTLHRVRRVTCGTRRTLVLWACAVRASDVCGELSEPCVPLERIERAAHK